MKQDLISRFTLLDKLSDDADKAALQQRGRDFEILINDVADDEGILVSRGYHTKDNKSEQIDGAIEIYSRIFLLEVKWVDGNLAASDLFGFMGKIENKFQGTLGVFISRKQMSNNFLNALNRGRRQSVIVLSGHDIDQLFSATGPTLKDYLTYCFKLLSYNNLTHFPVQEFIKLQGSTLNSPSAGSATAVKNFVTANFLNKAVDPLVVKTAFAFLGSQDQVDVFNFVLRNIRDAYYVGEKTFDFRLYHAYRSFLFSFEPSDEAVKQSIRVYYQECLLNDFQVYSDIVFFRLYNDYFADLPAELKNSVESFLVAKFDEHLGNWNTENKLTDFIKPVWKELSTDAQTKLKNFYLEIFVSRDRQNKFAQKQFSMDLLNSKAITEDDIKVWLDKKFDKLVDDYQGELTENVINWFAGIYSPLAPYLEIMGWDSYVKLRLSGTI